MVRKTLRRGVNTVVGMLLLHFSGSAFAFTIIELPDAGTSPGSSIIDSTTFNTQIQPVIGAIQAHILDTRRSSKSRSSAQRGEVLASNSYVDHMSDADFIKVSSHSSSGGGLKSLWFNSTASSFKNEFSGTRLNGDLHMLLAGFDYTLSDKYIFGFAVSFETSNTSTIFNKGNKETDGFSINPYFAYLISDTWSVDTSLGYGSYETDQFRTPLVALTTVTSDFDSTRNFISINLTNSQERGNWYLTSWLGVVVANHNLDSYSESDGTPIDDLDLDMKRWSLGGEAAYSHSTSESYLGLIYEKDTDINEVEFTAGEQPSNDDDSLLMTLGWRYYGADLIVNFEFNSRLGADDIAENSISSTLRIDL